MTEPSSEPRRRRSFARSSIGWSVALAGALTLLAPSARSQQLVGPAAAPGSSQSGGTIAALGETVGLLELEYPSQDEFILRGTLPVPRNTFPRADGKIPFMIRDADGTLVPAQVERVSSYPLWSEGADVVEVLARVHRPTNSGPGSRIRYEVVDSPHPRARPKLKPAVQALINAQRAVELTARDAYGHMYSVDLLAGYRKLERRGRTAVQVRYYGTMRPDQPVTSGPMQTLPHLFGAHSYVTYWADEEIISLDLRANNGPSGLDTGTEIDNPNTELYFESLNVVVPTGWVVLQAFDNPWTGSPRNQGGGRVGYPLVKAHNSTKLHMMPAQGQLERRLVLTPAGNEARARALLEEEGLGFARTGLNAQARPYYSWWNPSTARYFPQRHRLPELTSLGFNSVRGNLKWEFDRIEPLLASGASLGNYPVDSPVLGWAHPWGVKYGGMTSGTEIYFYDGMRLAYGGSKQGYRYMQMRHRMYTDRQPIALFNKNGEPTQLEDWLKPGQFGLHVHMLFYMRLLGGFDPFGFDRAPTHQRDYVEINNLGPDYEDELKAYQNIDVQHLVRYTNSPKVLVWLGNDAMAKDDLRMAAECCRLSYHRYPTDPNNGAIVSGLLSHRRWVNQHPARGFAYGRGASWGVDTMAAYYSVASRHWRQVARPWFDDVVDLVKDGQSACSGIIQAKVSSKILNGQYNARQSFEQAIIENALWGVKESVYRGVDPAKQRSVEQILTKSLYSMVNAPAWNFNLQGPHSMLAVAPLDLNLPPYCGTLPSGGTFGGADKYQTWSSFAYGYELTGDVLFLQRVLDMSGAPDVLTGMQGQNYSNLENRAAIYALVINNNYP